MLIILIQAQVKPESLEEFKKATEANATASRLESGIARFDLLQQADDPTRFLLLEAYRTPEAPAAHKETKHYQVWRDTVAPMMAVPRSSQKFQNISPGDEAF